LQETIEQVKIKIQFRRNTGIDFDLWCTYIITPIRVLKHPGPAVAAAEVAVIGEDEVEIQENLIT
jgi:hypothetical protein